MSAKVSCTVLRGGESGDARTLPDTKQNRQTSKALLDKAFPAVSHSENKHINVKGNKSPFDGDLTYWSERNSKLYNGTTSKVLKRQNHSCARCGLKTTSQEQVNLHHKDGNHHNWKGNNLEALHESCHDYIHKKAKGTA